jgi:hypothetical protein
MIALPAVTAAILASSVQAQSLPDTSARIRGAAISSYNGRPIAGVTVAAPEVQKFTVTDSSGGFALEGLPAGRHTIRVSYAGRETRDYAFTLHGERTKQIAVLLDVDAVDLDPLVVEPREVSLWRDLAGFYERRREYGGFARFLTREDIERSRPEAISVLLRGAGIFTWCIYSCVPARFTRGHICAVPVTVNGLPIWERDLDRIPIENVVGVEIYRDPPNSSPFLPITNLFALERKDLVQGLGDCGSVGIWTR